MPNTEMASSESIQVNVVVIGAGPAGSTAARYLATICPRLKIALLDCKEWPRPKHCAGGLTKKLFDHFPEMLDLNIYRGHARKLTAHGQKAARMTYHVPRIDSEPVESPRCVSKKRDFLFVMSERDELDAALVDLAIQKGVTFHQGTLATEILWEKEGLFFDLPVKGSSAVHVRALHEEKLVTFKANAVIVAPGIIPGILKTNCKKWYPEQLKRPASTVMIEYHTTPDEIQKYWSKDYHVHLYWNLFGIPGYFWIFPKIDSVNIGLVVNIEKKINVLKYFELKLKNLIKKDELPQGIIHKLGEKGFIKGFPLPLNGSIKKPLHDRCIIIGDAGGYVSPLHGEGIYYAMLTGKFAAETLAQHLDDRSTILAKWLIGYTRKCARHVDPYIKASHLFQRLLIYFGDSILRTCIHPRVKYLSQLFIIEDPPAVWNISMQLLLYFIWNTSMNFLRAPSVQRCINYVKKGLLFSSIVVSTLIGINHLVSTKLPTRNGETSTRRDKGLV